MAQNRNFQFTEYISAEITYPNLASRNSKLDSAGKQDFQIFQTSEEGFNFYHPSLLVTFSFFVSVFGMT
jgi:hypothetical protein